MFSTELEYTLEAAYREASNRRHAFFCVEHLLYALLFTDTVESIVKACGGDLYLLKSDLEEYFDNQLEETTETPSGPSEPVQTPAVQRVLQRTIMHLHSSGKEQVGVDDVFVAIFTEKDSHSVFFLNKQEITRLDVLNYISHGVTKVPLEAELEAEEDDSFGEFEFEGEAEGEEGASRGKVLENYTEDLTAQAKEGTLDPIIGRDEEIKRAIKVLCRRQKNNPLLLGEPGVGKTAMASALAQRIVSGDVPERLKDARLFVLHIGSLIAGTKFRGEFEGRLRKLMKELAVIPGSILFIDEIHTIVGAGATGSGSMDAANLLKPALASGKVRCIGSTTHEDYKKSFEKDMALSRRFSVIDIEEPSIDDTVNILKGLKERFEEHHQVSYSDESLKAAAELSAKHINERCLPDKAIDVIDEAGSANSMLSTASRKSEIDVADIEAVVSQIARVPVQSVSKSDEKKLHQLAKSLKNKVFGQDSAIDSISLAIKRSRANLQLADKPVGSFLFAGPTGVGKTELAKALAEELGIHFHRFDMSEYMEKHAVARLIGAPPGYVGFEEGGQLTDLIRKNPYSVLLFDEIEKAHQDIYSILLQVMDDALLTDSQGKKADFRNTIIIMTTNAGSNTSGGLGFGQQTGQSNRDTAIKKLFRPEFRNRLDDIIHFQPLPADVIRLIVDKFIKELEDQLSDRNIKFFLSAEAKAWLAQKGFDTQLGARPMHRTIQKHIKDRLTDEILFGRLKKGGKVAIDVSENKLDFAFSNQNAKKKVPEPQSC